MKKVIFLGVAVFLSGVLLSQNDVARLLDSMFTANYHQKLFNGNVLIADKGKIIFEQSYGLANEETKTPLNKQTIFELASVSKQFTAMGIVLLQKQGKLSYEDKLSKYIPELAFYGDITIRNLLNHTSGLPDYMELFEELWDKSKFATNQDIITELAKHRPEPSFAPGEKYEYSNTGYALLGSIIEKVSEQSFGQYLSDNIFKPLDMKSSFVYRSRYEPRTVNNYASGYVMDSTGSKALLNSFGKEFYTYYLDGIVGDGMVNSNLEDLFKWDRALYTDKLVNAKDKELIFSSVKTKNDKETNYGFGWRVVNDDKYGKMVSHSGSWAGYITYIERHLDNDKTIIILQNNATPLISIPSKNVRKLLYGEALEVDSLTAISLRTEELDKYLGVYSSEGFPLKFTIFKNGTTLLGQATGQEPFPLIAYENNVFKLPAYNLQLVFNPAENTMDFTQGTIQVKFIRE